MSRPLFQNITEMTSWKTVFLCEDRKYNYNSVPFPYCGTNKRKILKLKSLCSGWIPSPTTALTDTFCYTSSWFPTCSLLCHPHAQRNRCLIFPPARLHFLVISLHFEGKWILLMTTNDASSGRKKKKESQRMLDHYWLYLLFGWRQEISFFCCF